MNSEPRSVDRSTVLREYALDNLDPAQRVFAERVLAWAAEVVRVYKEVHAIKKTGKATFAPGVVGRVC